MKSDDDEAATKQLPALIEASGESAREIARRIADHGLKLSHAQISDLRNGTVVKAPDREAIEALAVGLRVPAYEVQAAVFHDWYGYTPGMMGGDRLTQNLPPRVRDFIRAAALALRWMPEEKRDALIDKMTRDLMAAAASEDEA